MKAKRRSSWLPCEKFELSRRKWRVPTDSHFQANGGHLILWTVLLIIPTTPFQSSHFRAPSSSDGLPSVPFKTKQNRTKTRTPSRADHPEGQEVVNPSITWHDSAEKYVCACVRTGPCVRSVRMSFLVDIFSSCLLNTSCSTNGYRSLSSIARAQMD